MSEDASEASWMLVQALGQALLVVRRGMAASGARAELLEGCLPVHYLYINVYTHIYIYIYTHTHLYI